MINVHRHNPQLSARLKTLVESDNGPALAESLSRLTNSEFRTAGFLLAEEILPNFPNSFWNLMLLIVPINSKAYLGTFLKAFSTICKRDATFLSSSFAHLKQYASLGATQVDLRKCLEAILPLANSPEEVHSVVVSLTFNVDTQLLPQLFKAGTQAAYFLMFKVLKTNDENVSLIRQYCLELMKRGDLRSFNLACILRTYFDLPDLPGSFSLKLQPYELGRLDQSYEKFCKLLEGKPLLI